MDVRRKTGYDWFKGWFCWPLVLVLVLTSAVPVFASSSNHEILPPFPPELSSYESPEGAALWQVLLFRIKAEPFNLIATCLFVLAIIHTFIAPLFLQLAHRLEENHQQKLLRAGVAVSEPGTRGQVSFWAEVCHFLSEVEAVFGIWVVPLLILLCADKGLPTARNYLSEGVNFTEPMFVVVIMTIAASRPILRLSERIMSIAASLGGGTPAAWWFSILTLGPLLGSFITEPAAMTISAMLLAQKFYDCKPSPRMAYATLGLLFVNVSVGGTLTHFAAPPVLMVAGKWNWDLLYMLTHFGWKAALGILSANLCYFLIFRRELNRLNHEAPLFSPEAVRSGTSVSTPAWVVGMHIFFLAWTVINNHFPELFIGGFLFYLAFTRATEHHQSELALRPALLVGFFLAGLLVHGGLQAWWIAPVLSQFGERGLFFGAALLTAFNDNAAITYLASLVPGLTEQLKYSVLAGAVAGGGLTVIANAPNPAGQSILAKFFPEGVSPLRLFLGALVPTGIVSAAFLLLK